MANYHGRQNRWEDQPGLEVVTVEDLPHYEVPPALDLSKHEEKHFVDTSTTGADQNSTRELALITRTEGLASDDKSRRRKKRIYIILGLVVAAAIATGATLGGVLGHRAQYSVPASSDAGHDIPPPTSTSSLSALPTPTSTTIRPGSPLSVTGWRNSNGTQIDIYYVGPDNTMRVSQYVSRPGSFDNGTQWYAPAIVPSAISSKSAVAAMIALYDIYYAPQVFIYYLDSSNELIGINRNHYHTPFQSDDSMNEQHIFIPQNSRLATYWPYIVYQDRSGTLHSIRNNVQPDMNYFPRDQWLLNVLPTQAVLGSNLAVVPLATNYTLIVENGGYGIVYQTVSGQLAITVPNEGSRSVNQSWSWPQAAQFPVITIPPQAGIAALTVARPNDTGGRVNTYILYQGTDLAVHMVWLDNDSSWSMSSPKAMAAADNGTAITCLTMPTTPLDANKAEVLLEGPSDSNRCYFQRSGTIVEFMLKGSDWVELDKLDLP